MANNYTQFSFTLADNVTDAERQWLVDYGTDDEDWTNCLVISDERALVFTDECGDVETAALLAQRFLAKFRPESKVCFTWADWCSKPRVDEFGGGLAVITAESVVMHNLYTMLKRERARRG